VDDDGRIYRHVAGGPDEHVGRVGIDGKIYARRPGVSPDRLVGRVEDEPLVRGGGAAFFLLLGSREDPD
jgi:hypothetical protein